MEKGGELELAELVLVESHLRPDRHHELDDVTAVAAGIRVVGLDNVSEQKRGAAICAAQLEHRLHARASVAGEEHQQATEG